MFFFLLFTFAIIFPVRSNETVAIVSMMKNPYHFETWLEHHRSQGIVHFFIRLEDSPKQYQYVLQKRPWRSMVTVWKAGIHSTKLKYRDPITNQIKRQAINIHWAVKQALEKNITWLLHIDSDELLFTHHTWLKTIELGKKANKRQLLVPNYEMVSHVPDMQNPFKEAKYFVDCRSPGFEGYNSPGKQRQICKNYREGKPIFKVDEFKDVYSTERMQMNGDIISYEYKRPENIYESLYYHDAQFIKFQKGKTVTLKKESVASILHFESSTYKTWIKKMNTKPNGNYFKSMFECRQTFPQQEYCNSIMFLLENPGNETAWKEQYKWTMTPPIGSSVLTLPSGAIHTKLEAWEYPLHVSKYRGENLV